MIYLLFTFSSAFRCCLSCGFLTFFFFFYNDPPTTEIYPLPLHAPLPISEVEHRVLLPVLVVDAFRVEREPADRVVFDALPAKPVVHVLVRLRLRIGSEAVLHQGFREDRKSTRLNSSHGYISYAVFCLKKT